jgi:hypothetical protein
MIDDYYASRVYSIKLMAHGSRFEEIIKQYCTDITSYFTRAQFTFS